MFLASTAKWFSSMAKVFIVTFARWSTEGIIEQVHDQLEEPLRQSQGKDIKANCWHNRCVSLPRVLIQLANLPGDMMLERKWADENAHIIVDTTGLLLMVVITAACVQGLWWRKRGYWKTPQGSPWLKVIWADGGYRGKFIDWAKKICNIAIDVVYKKDGQHGFEVLPRRWVVDA